jgi:hypothetical protein
MKKFIVWLVMSLYCMVAFALPRPSQIEDALASQNYAEARSMVAEVLREKPESARAHLLNAYLLVHADRNKAAANAELQTAIGLDKRGDVKSSALFGRVVAEIDQPTVARPAAVTPKQAAAPSLPPAESTFDWPLVLIVLAIAATGLYIVLRRRAKPAEIPVSPTWPRATTGASRVSEPAAAPVRSSAPIYEHPYATPLAPQQPMGAFGTAASVAGGVVAGSVLSDVLLHRHSSSSHYDDSADRRRRDRDEEEEHRRRDSWTPSYSDPSPVSTSTERSSFSSSSSSNDSWSSSSSYSSSSDSSSSSDYGSSSSSSSSDW